MMGVFVQINSDSHMARSHPVGYVIAESGCWEWVGTRSDRGYGQLNLGHGKMGYAHRWMYEKVRGPIPEGLTIDHLCRNRACVNPDHLEAVTMYENWRRGQSRPALCAQQTHCIHGHELAGRHLYVRADGGGRMCRTCLVERRRYRYQTDPVARAAILASNAASKRRRRAAHAS